MLSVVETTKPKSNAVIKQEHQTMMDVGRGLVSKEAVCCVGGGVVDENLVLPDEGLTLETSAFKSAF